MEIFSFVYNNKKFGSKSKFIKAKNCCRRVLESAIRGYVDKLWNSVTSQKLVSRDFRQIANSFINKDKSAILLLLHGPEVSSVAPDKAKFFAEIVFKNSSLKYSRLIFFLSCFSFQK